MKERIKGIIRLAVAFILFINAMLTSKGMNPIPFNETLFTEVASDLLTGLAIAWAWWKNNNMTKAAEVAQGLLKELKNGGMEKAEREAN